jgi:hypothetical protein
VTNWIKYKFMYNQISQKISATLPGNIRGFGEYGLEGRGAGESPTIFNNFFTRLIGILTVIAGIWFFFVLMTGGIQWISAGSDKAKVESARQKITIGIVGLVVVIGAIFIADIIGRFLGFGGITNPGALIPYLSPQQ